MSTTLSTMNLEMATPPMRDGAALNLPVRVRDMTVPAASIHFSGGEINAGGASSPPHFPNPLTPCAGAGAAVTTGAITSLLEPRSE